MPLTSQAEQQLRDALRAFGAAHTGLVAPSGQGKALEAWVLMSLADTVRQNMSASWSVSLRRGDGASLAAGASFSLPSQGAAIPAGDPVAPGYVLLEHKTDANLRFELRGSVRWRGRSGATHECDVSVLPAVIGEALRTSGGGYPHGLPIVAIECKDKGGIGTLDEMRQTLARMFDLVLVTQPWSGAHCRCYETRTHSTFGRWWSRYRTAFNNGAFCVLRKGSFQKGAVKLGGHYSIEPYPSIYSDPNGIKRLQSQFRNVLATARWL